MTTARWTIGRPGLWMTALAITVVRVLFAGAQETGRDRFLAVPIALEAGWPGTYPSSDVLVQTGLHSGFHLYVGLGQIAALLGVSPVLLWEIGLLASLFAICLLMLRFGELLTDRRDLAILATIALITMPGFRGGLAWTPFPSSEFTTGIVAGAMGFYGLWALWHGQWLRAGATAGLLFNVHPSMGSISALFVAVAVLAPGGDRRRAAQALALIALLASPNVIVMGLHLFAGGAPSATFADITQYQRQHTLRNFWDAGLPFYAALVALAVAGSGTLDAALRRHVRLVIAAVHALFLVYIVCVELLESTAVLMFFFFRASAYLKVLGVMLAIRLVALWWSTDGSRRRGAALAVLLTAGVLLQNETISAACMLLAVALALDTPRRAASARALALAVAACAVAMVLAVGWRRLGIPVAPGGIQALLVTLGAALPITAIPVLAGYRAEYAATRVMRPVVVWAAAAGLVILSTSLRHPYDWSWRHLLPASPRELQARARFDEPSGPLGGMARWARRALPDDALVALPPDVPDATAFRLQARRGLFVSAGDLAQLTYAPQALPVARQRMALLTRIFGDTARSPGGCVSIGAAEAREFTSLGATHLACRRGDVPRHGAPAVYEDTAWTLYALGNGGD